MSELYTDLPLPEDARELIEKPLTPFESLTPYREQAGSYELGRRPEIGYDVVLLFHRFGEVPLSTIIERKGLVVVEVETPSDRGLDRLNHTFPNVESEVADMLIPRAA